MLRRSTRRRTAAATAASSSSTSASTTSSAASKAPKEEEEEEEEEGIKEKAIIVVDDDDSADDNNQKQDNDDINNMSSDDDETFASYLQKKQKVEDTTTSSSRYFAKTVTPSPANSTGDSSDNDDDDEEKKEEEIIGKKRKRASSASAAKKGKKSLYFAAKGSKQDEKEEEKEVKKKKAKKEPAKKKTAAATTTKKKPAATTTAKKPKPKTPRRRSSSNPQPGEPDGNGGLNQPAEFEIEYSKTSRATCKRCDSLILKNSIRVAHRPLFRGKPGYKVYRHLPCAIFSEHVTCPTQVEGSDELNDEDYEALKQRIEESQLEIQEEKKSLEPDELVPLTFTGEIRSSPPGLSASLLPFQVEGTSWMYHQEVHTSVKGGILADEMGMGKTLQTITVVLDHRPLLQHCIPGMKHPPDLTSQELEQRKEEEEMWEEGVKDWKHEMNMRNVDSSILPKKRTKKQLEGGARAGTLVVCPVVALSQWKAEIEKFTSADSAPPLSVCIYHGPNRASEIPRIMLQKYDVVLTTYQVLEADMRKMTSPNRVECPNCGGKFKIDKLRVHLKYFCGEGAERTEAQARQQRGRNHRGNNRRRGFAINEGTGRNVYDESDDSDYDDDEEDDDKSKKGGKKKKGGKGKNNKKTPPPSKKKNFKKTKDDAPTAKKAASSKGKKKGKTSTQSKTSGKKKTTTPKRAKIKGNSNYDSESELSIDDDDVDISNTPRRQSRRSAAKQASKTLSKSAKQWDAEDDESEDYKEESSNSEEVESDDSVFTPKKRKQNKKKKAARFIRSSDDDEEESDDDDSSNNDDDEAESEENERVKRARMKQKEALESASSRRKSMTKSKKEEKKKVFPNEKNRKGKKPTNKKNEKKKRNKSSPLDDDDDDDDSDSSDTSSSDDDAEAWMNGIDMDELIQKAKEGSVMSPLHSFCWWRIVLDEAHYIKSRSSQTSQAAFGLTGVHRWCLSGTPLQNRVGEFYSLIRFLRLDPMAHYLCRAKGCDCKSLHYRMLNGKCQDCGHGSVQHYSHFNKYVLNPIQRDGYSGDGRRAMFVLKNEVLDKCLLRRTKENKAEDMNLPPRIVSIRAVRLHPVEEDFYNALYTQTRSSFDDYVSNGTLLNNYAHIFDLLMRMRQSVDHPYLVVFSNRDEDRQRATSSGAPAVANGTTDCDICHEPPTDRVVSSCCQTAFCRTCVLEYMATSVGISAGDNSTPCPSCRAPFSIDLNQAQEDTINDGNLSMNATETISTVGMPSLKELPHVATGSILRRLNLVEFATSTKIEALVEELVQMRQKSPGSKAIVFSQFVNMLDLIRWRLHSDPCLKDMGLGAKALHGGMDVKARDLSLKEFRENNNVRVLLMSLKAGGVALNLTVANHIYLMDPWWNPAAEMQAIDRTHRLGQYRPIRAVRFIAENTVEERILQLQEKKRLVFDGTVGRDAGSLKMLTVDDMKSLFA